MNRILRRPMFRMGGTPNEGIMTGLTKPKRMGFANGTGVTSLFNMGPQETDFEQIDLFDPIAEQRNRLLRIQQKSQQGKFLNKEERDLAKDAGIKSFPEIQKAKKTDEGYVPVDIANLDIGTNLEIVKPETEKPTKKNKKVTKGKEAPVGKTPSDLDTYKEILNLYKSELSASDDELKRQRFLELAKFGANLAAQPGGSLTQAIGSSAAKSLEGLTRIEEAKRKQDQTAKALALEAAIKQLEPGTIAKQVRDIKRLNPKLSDVEALDKVISGTATKGRTQETRISTYANDLYQDDFVESKTAGRKAAEAIEESGYGIGRFNKDPGEGNREVGTYYIIKDGKIGKYKGKDKTGKEDFSSPGDEDF